MFYMYIYMWKNIHGGARQPAISGQLTLDSLSLLYVRVALSREYAQLDSHTTQLCTCTCTCNLHSHLSAEIWGWGWPVAGTSAPLATGPPAEKVLVWCWWAGYPGGGGDCTGKEVTPWPSAIIYWRGRELYCTTTFIINHEKTIIWNCDGLCYRNT